MHKALLVNGYLKRHLYISTAGFKFLRKNMDYDNKGRAEPMRKTKTYSLNKAQFC